MYKQAIMNEDGELLGFDYLHDDEPTYDTSDDVPYDQEPPEFDNEDECRAHGLHGQDGSREESWPEGVYECEYCPGKFRNVYDECDRWLGVESVTL